MSGGLEVRVTGSEEPSTAGESEGRINSEEEEARGRLRGDG